MSEIEEIASAFVEEITCRETDRIALVGTKLKRRLLVAARIFSVLSHVYKQIKDNTFATQRSLYYNAPLLFGNQKCSDNVLRGICNILGVPRQSLHILPSSTGCLAGTTNLVTELPDQEPSELLLRGTIEKPAQIPSSCACITRMVTPRGCTIFVEKETAFAALAGIEDMIPVSLVVTGKGETDAATRAILAGAPRPVFGLVDADAYGIGILARVAGAVRNKERKGRTEEKWIVWRYVPDIIPIGLFIEDDTPVKAEGQRPRAADKEARLARALSERLAAWLAEQPGRGGGWARVLGTLARIAATGERRELEAAPSLAALVAREVGRASRAALETPPRPRALR